MLSIAIVAKTRGVGFAVLDDGELIDWGVKRFKGKLSDRRLAAYFLTLIDHEKIGIVVLPADEKRLFRFGPEFVRELADRLEHFPVKIVRVGKADLASAFQKLSREKIAISITERFPELQAHLPKKRRIWESESAQMLLFDAVALSVAAGNHPDFL